MHDAAAFTRQIYCKGEIIEFDFTERILHFSAVLIVFKEMKTKCIICKRFTVNITRDKIYLKRYSNREILGFRITLHAPT